MMTEEGQIISDLCAGFMDVADRINAERDLQNSDIMAAAIYLFVSVALSQDGIRREQIIPDITAAATAALDAMQPA